MTDTQQAEAPAPPQYAFRCKNCGRLETSEQAGERGFPAACPSCGYGVRYDPITGQKSFLDGENWEVLADLPADEQKALHDDHAREDMIIAHTPAEAQPVNREPQVIEVSATEGLTHVDEPGGELIPAAEPGGDA